MWAVMFLSFLHYLEKLVLSFFWNTITIGPSVFYTQWEMSVSSWGKWSIFVSKVIYVLGEYCKLSHPKGSRILTWLIWILFRVVIWSMLLLQLFSLFFHFLSACYCQLADLFSVFAHHGHILCVADFPQLILLL